MYDIRVYKSVRLIGNGKDITFNSYNEAADYIAAEYSKNKKTILSKFTSRRSHIYDYDVIYLNAETACSDLKW